MNPLFLEFKRKFSLSMYRNLKIKMGEMSFYKDFVNDTRGDIYPILQKSEDCTEQICNNHYSVSNGMVKRLFCQFFPYATYELSCINNNGIAGFGFQLPDAEATITVVNDSVVYNCVSRHEEFSIPDFVSSEFTLIVSCRPGAFDIYFKYNDKAEYLHTFYEDTFKDSNTYSLFSNGYVSLFAQGAVTVKEVTSYIDNGISIADIRPIKYENGEIILEQGRIHFTASVRMQEGAFQGIFSWLPGTAEFQFTGALFYDCGDGKWRNYVAPVILYNRNKKQWYVWVSSFEHEHVLAYGAFDGDPRFGVNVVDVTIMEKATANSEVTDFVGFEKDEDPDLIYDSENGRWLLAICRIDERTNQYVYTFFESMEPFANYRYIGRGKEGAETGGSFVKIDNELFFVCGNDFKSRSEYRIYDAQGMKIAKFNYPDGGFRGWGSVIPIKFGSRTRYFWLTFDRHKGSNYSWSYGNLYCFESN